MKLEPHLFPFLQMSLVMILVLHPLQVRNLQLQWVVENEDYNYPDLNDFNNTNITLIFEPDEDVEVGEKSAPIFVTDDAINEATEQVFIAELRLVSSIDPATVDLTTRPSTLCRIIDNDRKYKE